MINTSEAFSGKIRESYRVFSARFLSSGLEVAGDIRRIVVHWGCSGADNLVFGAVFSSYIEVQMDGNELALEGQELQFQIGLMVEDGVYEFLDLGYYTAQHPATSAYDTTFTALGRIATRMSGTFTWPESLNLSAIISALQTQTGLTINVEAEINTNIPIGKRPKVMSCRDALGVVVSVIGGYATEQPDGSILISTYSSTPNVNVDCDLMTKQPTTADYDNTVNGIKVTVTPDTVDSDGDETPEVSYTSGTVDTEVECEYMTAALFSEYASRIVGYSYRPATVVMALGDPRLLPQDVLSVTDIRDNQYTVPCMSIIHTFDGGFQTEVRSPNPEAASEIQGSIGRAINELKLEMLEVQRLFAKYARIDFLNVDRIESRDGETYWDLTTNELCLGGYLLSASPEYALSSSLSNPPVTGWSEDSPERQSGMYVWQRIALSHGDGTTEYTEAICLQGADGERGTGIWRVTNEPSPYTTQVGNFIPKYRIALSTVLSQSGATEILVGDIIERDYYHYPVGYVDSSYVYLGDYSSIRGAQGEPGDDGVGIVSERDYFTVTDSDTVAPDDPDTDPTIWIPDTPPTRDAGEFLWRCHETTYTDTSIAYSTPVCITGDQGNHGVGIAFECDYFTITNSNSVAPDDPETDPTIWTPDTPPQRGYREYIWRCHETTYTDASVVYSTPVCITGDPGDSGLTLIISSDKGSAFNYDAFAELTGDIYDAAGNLVDPDGEDFIIRWWFTQDGKAARYLNGGKSLVIAVNDSLCNYMSDIWFETIPIEESVFPFLLCKRDGTILTSRRGFSLSVAAAERYGV